MTKRFRRFLRRNTIALMALFVALSGTTFAAANVVLPKNSVGTKQLKKNAVTSVKIKNNQVTGADVKESSLGKVPSASNADHATSSDSATNATNATNSTNATNATNASHASTATTATTATNANALGGVAASGYVRKTGTLTIPGNAFHPTGTGSNTNCFPETTAGTAGAVMYAPVELPDGVTVTKLTYNWWDGDGTDSTVTLTRTILPATPANGGPTVMATLSSSGSTGVHSSSSTTSISNAVINNSNAMYYVKAVFPGAAECTDAVQITYSG
jgi:hypothetical protein